MKYNLNYILSVLSIFFLVGCESNEEAEHRRQLELIRAQGNVEIRMREAENGIIPNRNQQMVHTNQHVVHHHTSSNNSGGGGIDVGDVLLGAAVTGFLMSDWDERDDGRYYNRNTGKYVSNEEYYRRKAQSEKDKRLNAERKLANKNNRTTQKSVKPTLKPTYKPRATMKPKVTPRPRSTPKPVITPTVIKKQRIKTMGGKTGGQKCWNGNCMKNKAPARVKQKPKRTVKKKKRRK